MTASATRSGRRQTAHRQEAAPISRTARATMQWWFALSGAVGAFSLQSLSAQSPAPPAAPAPRSDTTLFRARLTGDRLRFEIPAEALDRDYLVTARVAKAPWSLLGPQPSEELGTRVARWERRGDRLFLHETSYAITADSGQSLGAAIADANYGAILAVFPIDSVRPNGTVSIDATKLFTTRSPEFAALRGQLDPARTLVERLAAFPDNVEVDVVQTAVIPATATAVGMPASGESTVSYVVHWSVVRLPRRPMAARAHDPRVGFHAVRSLDFGSGAEVRPSTRALVQRYRLEKDDADSGETSTRPLRPITFLIDPATPRLWVPWIKRGVEAWQPAFAAAGFTDAIVAREAPSPDEDPLWSPDDARYSVVRWLPSRVASADLSAIVDPRTGEVLSAQIKIFHNLLHQLRNWYIVQAGGVDPRVRHLPLPDSLLGVLLQATVTHEVGHVLGLQHNFRASALYPTDSLRSRRWGRTMGFSPSIMDYARANYVAQPEDSLRAEDLVRRVGPYDVFAIRWGYGTRADRRAEPASRWLAEQDRVPWLRFSGAARDAIDPRELTEAVGDADAVRATTLGVRNLARVLEFLRTASPADGWDDAAVRDVYRALGKQWETEILHVVRLVGGLERPDATASGYVPVSRERQRAAVAFVLAALTDFPRYIVDPRILRLGGATGSGAAMSASQLRLLSALLDSDRLGRLSDAELLTEASHGRDGAPYTATDLLSDVTAAVWADLATQDRPIPMHHRSLQRAYIEVLGTRLSAGGRDGGNGVGRGSGLCASTDVCGLARAELAALDARLATVLDQVRDPGSRAHLVNMRAHLHVMGQPLPTTIDSFRAP